MTRDRFDPRNPAHRAMANQLVHYKRRLVAAHGAPRDPIPWAEQERRLRALGYLD
jgi:hypothetical protein